MLKEGRAEIEQRVKSGEIQPAIVTGGAAFTDAAWSRILERMDANLEAVKEEQEERFARIEKEQAEKAILKKLEEEKSNVPYSYLAEDGVIEYNGVVFICDEEHHAITMFSPSDIRRIMETIATDAKCEQIALLLKDKERDEVI